MAGEQGASRSVTANALQNDMANLLSDIGTATTADYVLGFDVSTLAAGWAPVRMAGNDLLVMAGVTASATELNLIDGLTAGTVTASKAVVVDASKDIATFNNVTANRFAGRVQTLTAASTATKVNDTGYLFLTSSSAKTFVLSTGAALVAGTEKWIVDKRAAGTANVVVSSTLAGVTLDGTNGKATLNAAGEALHLVAVSTVAYDILENFNGVSMS